MSKEDELTAYAERSYAWAVEMESDSRERALVLAATVGAQAGRLGLSPTEASRWLQGAYGAIWVRLSNLNPGADLSEVRSVMLKSLQRVMAKPPRPTPRETVERVNQIDGATTRLSEDGRIIAVTYPTGLGSRVHRTLENAGWAVDGNPVGGPGSVKTLYARR